jgi:hypothetical protein
MTKVKDLHQKWMKSAEYRKAYEALKPEFELARARATRPERAVRETSGTSRGGPTGGAG